MERLKRWGVFLLILALLGAGTSLLFWDLGRTCLSVLRTGRGDADYLMTAADAEGQIYVLGRDEEGYLLLQGDQMGNQTERWRLTEELPEKSVPAALYPAAGGAVYLGLYSTEEETCLQLYRLTQQGQSAELLLNEPCPGENLRAQMAALSLSSFSQVDSVVTFALLEGDSATFYRRTGADQGLEKGKTFTQTGLLAALALSDGTQVLASAQGLARTDGTSIPLTEGEIIIELNQTGTGLCYVDGAGLQVFYADFTDWQPYPILDLQKEAYDLDRCTDLWITREGGLLLLMDGQTLLLDRGSTVSDLSGMLYPSALRCGLILGGLGLAVLVLSLAVWYVVCEQRRFRLPLLVRWGVLLAAVAALGTAFLVRGAVRSSSAQSAEREAASLMGALSTQALQRYDIEDSRLPQSLGDSLAGAAGGLYRDSAVWVYTCSEEGVWTQVGSNTALADGIRGEVSPGFDRTMAQQARSGGSLFWTRVQGGEIHYLLYQVQGDALLAVDVDSAALREAGWAGSAWMVRGLAGLALLLTALALAVLCGITIGVRRSLAGMERLAAGERQVRVQVGGGDELESLADDVNALSAALQNVEVRQQELAQTYRRFVPERILSLLGKTSIQEVDKQTFVSRNLAAMMLSFRFPPQVYEKSGRELFDNINEIFERTASIVTRKGGAVFNFAYDGYDAVFEEGSAAAVSTAVAVQQEVLEINRERELDGRPPVTVRIALDEGNVMLGVVGDENQIEPASISSSFSVAKHLVELCSRLEANILCTEAVIRSAQGYGSRYMGKCLEGNAAIRTYEIYDGDAYEIRKVKEDTGERFSQGVYALYGRDFSQAKRIFLSLVHHNTGDGGARYYLYLADRLEKRPEEEISLDSGR